MSPPNKRKALLEDIKICIERGHYLDTRHATERQSQRLITRPEILYVLKSGFHEKKNDKFDEYYQAWSYAIRGKTLDHRVLRVIISFEENGLLIITAIELKR